MMKLQLHGRVHWNTSDVAQLKTWRTLDDIENACPYGGRTTQESDEKLLVNYEEVKEALLFGTEFYNVSTWDK